VMLLYLLVNTAYLNLLSPTEVAGAKVVAIDAMKEAIGPVAGIFVAAAIMISTFGNVNTQILVKSRSWYAMARDQLFFKKLAILHPVYKTPNYSLGAQAFWTSILIVFASFAEHAYEAVIDFFSFTSSIFNVLTFYSVFILRNKFPDAPRPYRIWLYPIPLIIVLIIQITFMIATLITAFYPSMIGLLLTSSGLIYYKWFVPQEAKK
jgi:basic amino acid/polyamine antiporter, APA family